MADPKRALRRMVMQNLLEVAQLSRRAPHRESVACRTADRNPGGIISAVFQASQSLDDDGNYLLWTYISDDAAHVPILRDFESLRM
jgi:hypothetical protein